ncbi:MAG: hypothetical protein ACF8MF_08040 [Phycisphaerales bacterium JB052]
MARLTNRQLAWRAIGIKSLTRDEIIKQEQQATINTEVLIALVGGVLGWALASFTGIVLLGQRGTLLWNLIIPFCSSIVVSTLLWFGLLGWVRLRKFDRIAQIHLTHGICPSCAYQLDDLTIQEDGCVVCPECNGAWQESRVRQAHVTVKHA